MYEVVDDQVNIQAFARKIIRLSTQILPEDIENEARAVAAIITLEGHPHIVKFLGHGWLTGSHHTYYIDMELGTTSLAEYILCFKMNKAGLEPAISEPTFLDSKTPLVLEARIINVFLILTHIARGLAFLHASGHVHRDLKPSNGNILKLLSAHFSTILSGGLETCRFWPIH